MTSPSLQLWSIDNVRITCDSHWWGFVLHLNEDATQLLEKITDLEVKLVEVLGEEVKPIAGLIQAYLKARNIVIKAEDRGQGVRLVSPWIMPTLLVPLPEGDAHIDDTQLRWTVFDSGQGWADEQKMKTEFSDFGPSLAAFQDQLYCVYRGSGSDSQLSWTRFDGSWSDYQRIPNAYTSEGPSLAVFQGRLYCVYRGAGSDSQLSWMTFDGNSWSNYQGIHDAYTFYGPSLAVFQGRLYCVYRGGDGDPFLSWISFDGSSWTYFQRIHDANSSAGPSIAAFENKLYCVYRGSGSDLQLSWTTFDGSNWTDYQRIGGAYSSFQPAIVLYRHPSGTRDQLLCMHRGIST